MLQDYHGHWMTWSIFNRLGVEPRMPAAGVGYIMSADDAYRWVAIHITYLERVPRQMVWAYAWFVEDHRIWCNGTER